MAADLEKLETKYRDAQEVFAESRSEADKAKYKKAKQAFNDARTEVRAAEEADPEHPRGKGVASITTEDGSVKTIENATVGSEIS